MPERFFDTPADGPVWDAPARLRDPAHFRSNGWLRQQERADWRHADPRLMFWAARFVEAARSREIPLYVHCCLRDKAEQDRLVAAGHSRARYPQSAHNIAEAVDIVHGRYHWDMTRAEWDLLHVLGRLVLERVNAQLPDARKLRIVWGGGFKSLYDPAHWEIEDFRARRRPLAAGPPVYKTPAAILKEMRVPT